MENVFDVLCIGLTLAENKKRFQEEEGTELMCILMKTKGNVRLRAIKVLNHALAGPYGQMNCIRFVEIQGLKTLFGIFMGKLKHSSKSEVTTQDEEHILEIIMSLFHNLKSDSIERIRLISKFVEKEYEKVDRLLEIRASTQNRLKPLEMEIQEQKRNGSWNEEAQLYYYLERVDNGLFSLQLVDYALAWLIMEDDGILNHLKMLFARSNDASSFDEIIATLKEYYENVGDDALVTLSDESQEQEKAKEEGKEEKEEGEAPEGVAGLRLKDVIVNLVNYILSIADL